MQPLENESVNFQFPFACLTCSILVFNPSRLASAKQVMIDPLSFPLRLCYFASSSLRPLRPFPARSQQPLVSGLFHSTLF